MSSGQRRALQATISMGSLSAAVLALWKDERILLTLHLYGYTGALPGANNQVVTTTVDQMGEQLAQDAMQGGSTFKDFLLGAIDGSCPGCSLQTNITVSAGAPVIHQPLRSPSPSPMPAPAPKNNTIIIIAAAVGGAFVIAIIVIGAVVVSGRKKTQRKNIWTKKEVPHGEDDNAVTFTSGAIRTDPNLSVVTQSGLVVHQTPGTGDKPGIARAAGNGLVLHSNRQSQSFNAHVIATLAQPGPGSQSRAGVLSTRPMVRGHSARAVVMNEAMAQAAFGIPIDNSDTATASDSGVAADALPGAPIADLNVRVAVGTPVAPSANVTKRFHVSEEPFSPNGGMGADTRVAFSPGNATRPNGEVRHGRPRPRSSARSANMSTLTALTAASASASAAHANPVPQHSQVPVALVSHEPNVPSAPDGHSIQSNTVSATSPVNQQVPTPAGIPESHMVAVGSDTAPVVASVPAAVAAPAPAPVFAVASTPGQYSVPALARAPSTPEVFTFGGSADGSVAVPIRSAVSVRTNRVKSVSFAPAVQVNHFAVDSSTSGV